MKNIIITMTVLASLTASAQQSQSAASREVYNHFTDVTKVEQVMRYFEGRLVAFNQTYLLKENSDDLSGPETVSDFTALQESGYKAVSFTTMSLPEYGEQGCGVEIILENSSIPNADKNHTLKYTYSISPTGFGLNPWRVPKEYYTKCSEIGVNK